MSSLDPSAHPDVDAPCKQYLFVYHQTVLVEIYAPARERLQRDMSAICRLCLKGGPDLMIVMELRYKPKDSESISTENLILKYISLEIAKGEPLHKSSICPQCKAMVEEWHHFHETCLENDKKFNSVLDAKAHANSVKTEPFEWDEISAITEELNVHEANANNDNASAHESPNINGTEYDSASNDMIDDTTGKELTDHNSHKLKTQPRKPPRRKRKKDAITSDTEPAAAKVKRGRPKIHVDGKPDTRGGVCTICGEFRKNMYDHMRMHNNDRRHKCPYCSMTFLTASNCKSHVNIHTREKMYKCELCDKEYTMLNGLKQHRATHAKKRIYECLICGKSYYQRTALARHKRNHFEEPKIKCSECDMLFLTNCNLRSHFRKHLGAIFHCEICSKGFYRKENLKTHMKTHRVTTKSSL